MKVGFIGLGIMGKPMAKNLLMAGYNLMVWDIVGKAADELVETGAKKARSTKEIAEYCDVIITMLPDGPQVKEVVLGEEGMLTYLKSGALLIDMSSISPVVTGELQKALKEKGVRLLDAPVSGAELKAIDGSLAIMVGGDEKDFQDALPLFEIMGGKITLVGPSGSGSACKLTNQIIIAVSMAAVCEAFMLAKKSGCDLEKVLEAISTGFAGSTMLDSTVPRILARNYEPGFRINLHKKDLTNAMNAALSCGAPVPLTENLLNVMKELSEGGDGNSDNSSIAKYYEKIAGTLYTE